MKGLKLHLNSQHNSFDFLLLAIVSVIVLIGLIAVFSVSSLQAFRQFNDSYFFIKQQLLWVLVGTVCLIFLSKFDYHNLKIFAGPLFGVALLLLVAVFIPGLGVEAGGASRWLKIGSLTIQPTEILKLASVIWLAVVYEKGLKLKPIVLLFGIIILLISFLQKDLGSATVLVAILISIFLIAGGSILKIFLVVPPLLIGLILLVLTSDYRKKRVLAFFNPFSDTQGFTYHISQALIALGSGGLLGVGIGESRQKFFIPEVTTDSIFAVLAEEVGFVGSVLLIILFALIIIRGFRIAEKCNDNLGKILAGGLTSWLGFQVIINLAAMVALVPLTGVPLPFVSYGGSALVANLAAIGILLNISKNQ